MANKKPRVVLRRNQVEDRTGLSTSAIYELMSKDEFPKPIKLTPRASGWIEEEIDEWVDRKVAVRDEAEQAA